MENRPKPARETLHAMPLAAIVLVVLLLGAFLWLLYRSEREQEYHSLIKNILWVEQNLGFQLATAEERLEHLAEELARRHLDMAHFKATAGHLVANGPEIERILLLGPDRRILAAVPPSAGGEAPVEGGTFTMAAKLGKRAFSGPVSTPPGGTGFEMQVPVFRDGKLAAMLVAIFSLDDLLGSHVPWWVAEKYRVSIVDGNGNELGTKSRLAVEPGRSYVVPLDPPGHDMALKASVYPSETSFTRNALAAAILGLAVSAILSLWAVRRHIQRRVAAEQALHAEHAFRKAMEDSLTVGMRARDLEGRITYVNPAFCRMVGWPAEDLVGRSPPMPYWLPEDVEATMALNQAVLDGQAPREGFELQFRRRDGDLFDALIYEAPLIGADGRHTGWMGSVLDITDRKRAQELAAREQEKLQQTARLVTMGEMASSLAHELNQPLAAIASYATGCLNKLASGKFVREDLIQAVEKLAAQAQRAGRIIRRVHDFVRKSEPNMAPCFLDDVIEDSIGFVEADARQRGVRIETDIRAVRPLVLGDRIMLGQVMLNLIRNGMEAMIETPAADRRLLVSTTEAEGMILVAVADRGTGVMPDAVDRLFTPFFSTKSEGMGMGLNICRSVIEQHRGRLWFQGNPEGGSVFRFALPMAEP
ncbi:MAG: PAS domain S-box protein [Magnetospirillum sp. WYHS-4]